MPFLPDDVLWHIFSQNTPSSFHSLSRYPDQFSSWWPGFGWIRTAAFTSQVCRSWRRVMLSSPNIWSKVIDLRRFDTYSQPILWLSEILSRARGQRLYVYGSVFTFRGLLSLLEVVRTHWRHIEVFQVNLVVQPDKAKDLVHHIGWKMMSKEIPTSLQYFEITDADSWLEANGIRYFHLNSQTPNLRYLCATGRVQVLYEPQAPLFRKLRVLSIENTLYEDEEEIDGDRVPWTTTQLFNVLKYTPLLEVLSIHDRVIAEDHKPLRYQSRRQIHLPHLRALRMYSDISVCLATLLHIEPSTICALDMRVFIDEDQDWPTAWVVASQEIILNRYAKRAVFDSNLVVNLTKHNPSIELRTHPANNHFVVVFDTSQEGSVRATPFPFLDFLSNDAFDFSRVTSLRLLFKYPTDLHHLAPPVFHSVLSKLIHVRFLACNWEFFHHFVEKMMEYPPVNRANFPSQPSTSSHLAALLPVLEQLSLYEVNRFFKGDFKAPLLAIVEFCKIFRHRGLDGGTGLSKLERLELYDMGINDELNFFLPLLDGVNGLQVVFRHQVEGKDARVTEVCGSGRLSTINVQSNRTRRAVRAKLD